MGAVRMLVADVDGTLLRDDKTLAPSTVAAVRKLREAGIAFTLASARPPLGLRDIAAKLGVRGPCAAFNGGVLTEPHLGTQRGMSTLSGKLTEPVAELLAGHGLDMWAYCGLEWLVLDPRGRRVDWEAECVGFRPRVIRDWGELPGRPAKLTGVGDDSDPGAVLDAGAAVSSTFRTALSASPSTRFYLDITPPGTDKGYAVRELAQLAGVPLRSVAVIGDGYVDIPMFLEHGVGLGIAMGNAPDTVKMMATAVTSDNEHDGFAEAVREYVL